MMRPDWAQIATHISETVGQVFKVEMMARLGGGSINQAWHVRGQNGRYFVKINSAKHLDMFVAEIDGLQLLAVTDTVAVPKPLCCGVTAQHAYLVLEYLDLIRCSDAAAEALGEDLAAMHHCTAARFGWHRHNTIGTTPQINTETADWPAFWSRQRLGFQLELAARNGHQGRLQQRGERLLSVVDLLLTGHRPQPSLLHGDLWSGNYATTATGRPVVFDPAPYYGDRETDLAMTELFGGFSAGFYRAYHSAWPLADGYEQRRNVYNLYHILNHLNLFGATYRAQAEAMIDMALADLGY